MPNERLNKILNGQKRTTKEINLEFLISMILLVLMSLNSGATFGYRGILVNTWRNMGILGGTQ
jgi:hypothetical protein